TRFMQRVTLPELATHGFVEGRNLVVEMRTGGADELPELARELVGAKPDVVFAISAPALRAVAAATSTVPIVMLASADPVEAGWVDSLARPGHNVTGVTILGAELDPKRLQLMHELIPGARRLAALRDPAVTPDTLRIAVEGAARDLGIALDVVEARTPDE